MARPLRTFCYLENLLKILKSISKILLGTRETEKHEKNKKIRRFIFLTTFYMSIKCI
jgi:hypothetical protein